MPQIEVSFDIDANGILKVSAKDKGTGKAQEITISGSTNLDQGEIERMVSEAQQHGEEDKLKRKEVEERNEADSLVYQVERQMQELGEKLPVHEKARLEQTVNELKKRLAAMRRWKKYAACTVTCSRRHTRYLKLPTSKQKPAAPAAKLARQQATGGGDDVVDAEFEEQ
jgi:molecular chaperone DnaK